LPTRLVDTVGLELLVLERDASDSADRPFAVAGSAACKVKYRFKRANPDRACLRPFESSRPMRASPAAMMKESQLLLGRFAGSQGLALAFADVCLVGREEVLSR
jgi:hypothetical protein